MSLVAVCAGKGSPGATFVSLNLARALNDSGAGPLLVDLDSHGGDLAAYLGLDPRKGIQPLRLMSGGYTPEGLIGEVDERAGIACINGFPRAEDANSEAVSEILSAASATGRFVVADLGRVSPGFAGTAGRADLVLVVARPDIVSVHGAERAIETLRAIGIAQSKVGVVVTDWKWRQVADVSEIADALRIPVLGMIPNGPRAIRAAMRNQTPVTAKKIARAFDQLAREVGQRISASVPEMATVS